MAVVWAVADEARRVLACRRAFRSRLHEVSDSHFDMDAAELIFGELVANTVRYAAGAVEVQLEMSGDDCVLTVRDHGPGLRVVPSNPRRDPFAESGRGLAIVEMLARDVTVDAAPDGGTVVRAVLPVARKGAA